VELLYGAAIDVQSGRPGAASRFSTLADSVVKLLSEPVQRQGFGEYFSYFTQPPNLPAGAAKFTSAHLTSFPGDPIPPLFICRAEQWARSVRAIRCCGQTYRIDEVTTDGCYGDLVVIRGEGFRSERSWYIGTGDTELKSDVIFAGVDGGRVAPADEDYVSWSDTEVQVRLPEGAVSGPVEMLIICTRNLRGEPIGYICGLQTRLPAHTLRDTVITVGAATIEQLVLVINGRTIGARAGETIVVEAEACKPVRLYVRVARAESVEITDSSGNPVEFPEGSPDPQRTVEGVVELQAPTDESYTVRATSSCGNSPPRSFQIERYLKVTPSVASLVVTAGTPFAGEVCVSCSSDVIDRDDITVTLRVVGDDPGISLRETEIAVPAGRDCMPFMADALSAGCGPGIIEASVEGHRSGSVGLTITPTDVQTTFTGAATMFTNDSRFSGPFIQRLTLGVRFLADRETVAITNFPDITTATFPVPSAPDICGNTNQVTVRMIGGGVGTWDCVTGEINIPVELDFTHTIGCTGNSTALFTLTTEISTSPGGAFSLSGTRTDSAGNVTIAGASRFIDGFLGGEGIGSPSSAREFSLAISGSFAPAPPPCCV
jgi:hypothetical protein